MITALAEAPREAALVEVRNFFGLTSKEISDQWKVLNEDEKLYFKTAVAAENDRVKI